MRKLIIIVAVMLAPFAMYIAGCRRDGREAAFPKGPEVKGLARKAGREPGVPEIAARPATIDKEIAAGPDESTISRIARVRDTEARLASQHDSPGLYVLPTETEAYYAATPTPQPFVPTPVYESELPRTVDREFWSRSPAYAAIPQSRGEVPADVYAMAPAHIPEPLPEPVPTASWSTPAPVPEPLVFPEAVPGVYMGGSSATEPPPSFEIPGDPADWLGLGTMPEGRRPAPILSAASFESVDLDHLNSLILEPVKPAAPAPTPAGTELGERLAALLNNTDVRQALEPLPVLSARAGTASDRKTAAPLPAVPSVLTPPNSSEQLVLDLTALMNLTDTPEKAKEEPAVQQEFAFMPEPPRDKSLPKLAAMPERDTFLRDVDFWESKLPPVELKTEPAEATPLADLTQLASLETPTAAPAVPELVAPQKVTLLPLRPLVEKPRARNNLIDRIDAATEVPPLRF